MKKIKYSKSGWEAGTFKIVHKEGLHTRPAAQFARIAQQFAAQIEVQCGRQKGDGKSVLSLLALGVEPGCRLTIRARGSKAGAALKALGRFIQKG